MVQLRDNSGWGTLDRSGWVLVYSILDEQERVDRDRDRIPALAASGTPAGNPAGLLYTTSPVGCWHVARKLVLFSALER